MPEKVWMTWIYPVVDRSTPAGKQCFGLASDALAGTRRTPTRLVGRAARASRGTAALLERQKSLKRCRHLLEAWGGQRLQTLESCIAVLIDQIQQATEPHDDTDMEMRIQALFDDLNRDALRYQELYYTERKHISHLNEPALRWLFRGRATTGMTIMVVRQSPTTVVF